MKEIYIIRHGQTDYNAKHIIQGSGVDSDLNDLGRQQARAFYDHYKGKSFEKIFTSKLKRTLQTVQPFIDTGIEVESWAEINEIDWGIHEGKPFQEWMRASYKNLISEWGKGNHDARIEEGESAGELRTRISTFVDHLRTISESSVLVCTHGRAIKCMMTVLKKEQPGDMEKYSHNNTGLWKVIHANESFIVEIENNLDHLG